MARGTGQPVLLSTREWQTGYLSPYLYSESDILSEGPVAPTVPVEGLRHVLSIMAISTVRRVSL